MSIRARYQENEKPESYYSKHASSYNNPHENIIRAHLENKIKEWDTNNSILDLSCGEGLVTRFLQENGFSKIKGSDPFFKKEYERKTNCFCYETSFLDIANNKLEEKFDIIICSFALHLCDKSLLPVVCYSLSSLGDKLVIITPHKRPEIKNFWNLVDEVYFSKVRLREYKKFF